MLEAGHTLPSIPAGLRPTIERGLRRWTRLNQPLSVAPLVEFAAHCAEAEEPWAALWCGSEGLSFVAQGALLEAEIAEPSQARILCSSFFEQVIEVGAPAPMEALVALNFDNKNKNLRKSDGDFGRTMVRVPRRIMWSDSSTGEQGWVVHAPTLADALRERPQLRPLSQATPFAGQRRDVEARADFEARVAAAATACTEGRLEKVVLARAERLEAEVPVDLVATLVALRERDPESTVFAIADGRGGCFLGATPERLATLEGRHLRTHALAGTAPRDADPRRDAELGAALLCSPKDSAEHAFVVEGLRAALAPLCERIAMESSPHLRRLARVQHLEQEVEARLAEGVDLLDAVAALHPTPALGGRPRAAALEWLRRSEPLDRGWYGAPIGWLGPRGGAFHVAIRSALIQGRSVTAYAGAGIVATSDPASEWAETRLKLRTATEALRLRDER